MDRLDSMRSFVAAVEAGSLSAAARGLNMPLATFSRKVADLEAHIGARLLLRTSRRLELTEAGRGYHAACRRILEDVALAERAAAGEYVHPQGELAVAAPIVFGRLHILPLAMDFLRTYPKVSLRLQLADRLADLVEEHIDVALRIGELPDSSMLATRVGLIRRVVCGSPAYFAQHGRPQRPQDLAAHACICFGGPGPAEPWLFVEAGKPVAVALQPRLSVNTVEGAIDAAAASFGVTRVFSYQIAAAVQAGQIEEVLQDFAPPPIPVSLLTASTGMAPLKLRAFLDFAAPRLRARLARPAG